jgi:hypothetical protein
LEQPLRSSQYCRFPSLNVHLHPSYSGGVTSADHIVHPTYPYPGALTPRPGAGEHQRGLARLNLLQEVQVRLSLVVGHGIGVHLDVGQAVRPYVRLQDGAHRLLGRKGVDQAARPHSGSCQQGVVAVVGAHIDSIAVSQQGAEHHARQGLVHAVQEDRTSDRVGHGRRER